MKQQFDILFIGGGPASLSGALHLRRLANQTPGLKDISIAVLEKAPNVGDHSLSGASLDTRALAELFPDFEKHMALFGPKVAGESLGFLTKGLHIPSPIVPPQMSNHGCYIVSLSEFTKWLAGQCEREGVEIYTGEPADDLIMTEAGAVGGVVVKDKGLDKEGKRKPNYLEPTEVAARVTVLGEGSRGHLTKRLIKRLGLDSGCTPQGHAAGLKEVWEVKEENFRPGRVAHTMGYPLGLTNFGGSFMYHHKDRLVALGLVVSLDYRSPELHPFELFQRWKMHPFVDRTIRGGKLIAYGAKTLSEGGWFSVPRLYGDGFLIIGEAAGFLDSMRLKGVHLAMKSGMLAAEAILEALTKRDCSAAALSSYKKRIDGSYIKKELWRRRNFHQGYHHGLIPGMIHTGLQIITGGRGLKERMPAKEDWRCMRMLKKDSSLPKPAFVPDGHVSFDKLSCVFASGTKHDEDQPCHLKIEDMSICNGRCAEEYGNPCQFFCPASVYEMVEDENGKKVLQLNPTNCVHCKTCDIKDPYEVITWAPPEGGGGPNYKGM
ncbi:MAG: electron transfer flavoprotein-ubiquinone oxidoreductase [Pseudomonadota bacterium]